MGKKKQKFGFVQAPEAPPVRRGRHAVRPGAFNLAGEFFDPEGRLLEQVADDLTFDEAQKLVVEGALVVYEQCGCGGGCGQTWADGAARTRLRRAAPPHVPARSFAGNWIELWVGPGVDVVFIHGDLVWGDVLT